MCTNLFTKHFETRAFSLRKTTDQSNVGSKNLDKNQACPLSNHPNSPQAGDSKGASIDLDDDDSKSYVSSEYPIRLSPTEPGDIRIDVIDLWWAFIRRAEIDELFRTGKEAAIRWKRDIMAHSGCAIHPNGAAITISLVPQKDQFHYIIPRHQFEQVFLGYTDLVVYPCKEAY
jgi:hypothetical protein